MSLSELSSVVHSFFFFYVHPEPSKSRCSNTPSHGPALVAQSTAPTRASKIRSPVRKGGAEKRDVIGKAEHVWW